MDTRDAMKNIKSSKWLSGSAAKKRCRVQRCNLCFQPFISLSLFERFCLTCKKENELYRYYETLPQISDTAS